MAPIEERPPRPTRLRWIWLAAGWISLGSGVAGIVLPLVPTTPLVLLAAFCFARGSEHWHAYLLNHPRFGPMIQDWHHHGVIRPRAKWSATVLLGLAFGLTVGFSGFPLWGRVLLALFGVGILFYIWSRPSRPVAPAPTPALEGASMGRASRD